MKNNEYGSGSEHGEELWSVFENSIGYGIIHDEADEDLLYVLYGLIKHELRNELSTELSIELDNELKMM